MKIEKKMQDGKVVDFKLLLDDSEPVSFQFYKNALLTASKEIAHEQPCSGCRRLLKGSLANFLTGLLCQNCWAENFYNQPPFRDIDSWTKFLVETETARRKQIASGEFKDKVVRFGIDPTKLQGQIDTDGGTGP
jgi:hypothetical protein